MDVGQDENDRHQAWDRWWERRPAAEAGRPEEEAVVPGAALIMAKGFGIGLGVAAPIGPVNIEIIRRGLRAGFLEPFVLGMGAVTADGVYLALVCLGVSQVAQVPAVRISLMTFGVAMLGFLGVMAIRDGLRLREIPSLEPKSDDPSGAPSKRSLWRVYGLGIAMMATNPMSVAAWLSFSSVVIGSAHANPMAYVWFALSVPVGCTTWVVFISTVLHFGRRFVNLTIMRAVNMLGGAVLLFFAALLLRSIFTG
jgi:threonine/homoserine/homoserine lactone efflux protein